MTEQTRDRALELAIALLTCPWVHPSIQKVCEKLTEKWEVEDRYASHGECGDTKCE